MKLEEYKIEKRTISYSEFEKIAEEYNSKVLCTDKRFRYAVSITKKSGSTFFFTSGFIVQVKNEDQYIFVITEHDGLHIYDIEEVELFYQFRARSPFKTEKNLEMSIAKI